MAGMRMRQLALGLVTMLVASLTAQSALARGRGGGTGAGHFTYVSGYTRSDGTSVSGYSRWSGGGRSASYSSGSYGYGSSGYYGDSGGNSIQGSISRGNCWRCSGAVTHPGGILCDACVIAANNEARKVVWAREDEEERSRNSRGAVGVSSQDAGVPVTATSGSAAPTEPTPAVGGTDTGSSSDSGGGPSYRPQKKRWDPSEHPRDARGRFKKK